MDIHMSGLLRRQILFAGRQSHMRLRKRSSTCLRSKLYFLPLSRFRARLRSWLRLPPSMKERFRCFIIGDGSLTIRCADILQKEGHEIRGIITSNPDVKSWASANGSPHLDYSPDVLAAMREEPFDYLFSIVNIRLLPGEMVALPRRGAINFHDGPLPRYAGVHATSWALMNRERTHGVTWHFIGDIIDGGEILKQHHFQVSENETAYSLNMMCFEAGAQTFSGLVLGPAGGTSPAREHDLRHRNYLGMYERPPAAFVISLQNRAARVSPLYPPLEIRPNPKSLFPVQG